MISLKYRKTIVFPYLLISILFSSCGIFTPEEEPGTYFYRVTSINGFPIEEFIELHESEYSDEPEIRKKCMDIPIEFKFIHFIPGEKKFVGMVKFYYSGWESLETKKDPNLEFISITKYGTTFLFYKILSGKDNISGEFNYLPFWIDIEMRNAAFTGERKKY